MMRRAFTLIELLVVISIVAILAAILMPVVGRARDSARKATCISNYKQVGYAHLMYSGSDYDERVVPASYIQYPNEDPIVDRKWPQLLRGYIKSFGTFECPADRAKRPNYEKFFADLSLADANAKYYYLAERTNLGYNALYLSPFRRSAGRFGVADPVSMGMVAEPSNTLCMVDSVWHVSPNGTTGGGGKYMVEPPCRYASEYGGGRSDTLTEEFVAEYDGWDGKDEVITHKTYGGAYPWHDGQLTVAYVDGHVKSKVPNSLTQGCQVKPAWEGDIVDFVAYAWDLR